MAGILILDTALVTLSRTRRGVTLVTGGRDHLSHRLLPALRSPRAVAAALAVSQAALCVLAILGARSSGDVLAIGALITVSQVWSQSPCSTPSAGDLRGSRSGLVTE